ncbi:protein kinase domain-containing protein [Mycobacterium sp.]|uniref:serine/threonine-protein kinase n=1 Tax=Mycobacterium sp. TaxID=1785 RepID=UPI003C772C89
MTATDSRVGTTFGKYEITGVLGKGGMGEVYEAYDNEIGRTVALKIIKSEYANDHQYRIRFERESHAAATLQEPHVIPIHGFGQIDGSLFIDMRLVRGTDLESLLDKSPLEPSRAVAIITQIAAALDAAHAEGLIHRDVKPQNIIVTPADFAYLVDFGIAEMVGDTRLTAFGAQIGSWVYMAPERFTGQEITPAVDVYALTCVLYESLTGQVPFPADSQEAVVAAHLTLPPPRPSVTNPKVPPAFDDVIARGMAKEPDDRYGSAGALGRAANRALQEAGRTALNPPEYAAPTQYLSWPPMPRTQFEPSAFPPPGPSSGPEPFISGGRPGDRARWVVPTVVGVSAALVLGAIGVVIGVLAKVNSGPAPSAAPVTPMTLPGAAPGEGSSPPISQVPIPSRPEAAALPPIVPGPDQSASHTSCDQGYVLRNVTGFGTHSGRGTSETSCYFANTVLDSYWNAYGDASTAPRTVSAPGAVDCLTIPGANCDSRNPANFLMQCGGDGSNPWIKCTGGKDAVVYLW